MAKGRNREINLPSLDELFSSQEERDDAKLKRIYEIPLEEIDAFPDHPFKVRDDEDMMNLIESVKTNGIITPAILREKEDGRYEIISGHRRKRACELAGIGTLRAEIVEMSRDEAIIFMVESNFQRSQALPSEKGFAFKMRLEAMNRQGKRTDLTFSPSDKKYRSGEIMAKEAGESQAQIYRYIRITELIPELRDMVDEGKMALRPAVELSYLCEDAQRDLVDVIDMEQSMPSHDQAIRMRKMEANDKLTYEAIEAIMSEVKPNQRDRLIIRGDKIFKRFPEGLPREKREDFLIAAMDHYNEFLRRRNRDRER